MLAISLYTKNSCLQQEIYMWRSNIASQHLCLIPTEMLILKIINMKLCKSKLHRQPEIQKTVLIGFLLAVEGNSDRIA